ncbi:energy-coupling factor transport system ATP-binding protein [Microbacterium endophyticum]|uniref:Energy-coupling factor transport system ATP-binding protein n=1 Tax=Microbacterium endophyticum TaxID=1526412 RepID=A0A7W4V6D8_9MICO|nr:ABC transporter ATP-binding protein [Microbacterium endophyticum]MBB2977075.1 energy-coupling factor transport system ATP-binding protein [Microbacterium endophyticum]NIK36131.1 energy-coupling factor transport system ATP-binding protein [Microbacterium endophyticum]
MADAAPTQPALARIDHLGVRYDGASGDTPSDVSFTVMPGDIVLVLGPSGSGKSTLALTLNGLIPQSLPATVSGRVEIAGYLAADTPVSTLSQHVGMVFQDPDTQVVTGTLLDEVAFGPENLRLPVADVLERAESALRKMSLWHRRDENPDVLSGGGRQRLAMAAAIAMGSALLVLDEPTANLDPQGIEDVYAALAELAADPERGILLIEHNLDAAIAIANRVVVVDQLGRVVADGSIDAILRDRATELHDLGVWLPTSALAALRLRRAGYHLDPLPLTPAELTTALDASPSPSDWQPTPIGGATAESRMPQPVLSATNLRLRRGRTEVLHGIDLEIHSGDFVAIVGGNGAGKTTLLQALSGVVPPPRGSVFIDGKDITRLGRGRVHERVGFVFQNPEHQFIAHTVFDELAFGLRRNRFDEHEVGDRVDEMLRRFGLAEKADAHPFHLSGGQKRRLSVGTALISGAAILALDEPTFGQDRARADELLALLRDLNHEGTTIIIVTHDMQLVTEYAHRTIVMRDGEVLAARTTEDIFTDTALINSAGLRLPPLRQALQGVTRHPELSRATRLDNLPGSAL